MSIRNGLCFQKQGQSKVGGAKEERSTPGWRDSKMLHNHGWIHSRVPCSSGNVLHSESHTPSTEGQKPFLMKQLFEGSKQLFPSQGLSEDQTKRLKHHLWGFCSSEEWWRKICTNRWQREQTQGEMNKDVVLRICGIHIHTHSHIMEY